MQREVKKPENGPVQGGFPREPYASPAEVEKMNALLRERNEQEILRMGKGAIPALVGVVKEESLVWMGTAALMLGKIGVPALPALVELLWSDRLMVSMSPVLALRMIASAHPRETAKWIASYVNGEGGERLARTDEKTKRAFDVLDKMMEIAGERMGDGE